MKVVQDIQTSDISLWSTFQEYWQIGNYAAAIALLRNNEQLLTKYADANYFNEISAKVNELEIVSTTPKDRCFHTYYIPAHLEEGEVFYQVNADNVRIGLQMACINTGETTVTITYPANRYFYSMICFQNGEQVIVDTTVDWANRSFTFTCAEAATDPVWCVLASRETTPTITVGTIDVGGTSTNISTTSGNILTSVFAIQDNEVIILHNLLYNSYSGAISAIIDGDATSAITIFAVTDTNDNLQSSATIDSDWIGTQETSLELDGNGYVISSLTLQRSAQLNFLNLQVLIDVSLDYEVEDLAKVKYSVADSITQDIFCQLIHT